MPLNIRSLDFGSLFSYTPRPDSMDPAKIEMMKRSRDFTLRLKQDAMVKVSGFKLDIPISKYVALYLKKRLDSLPYSDFFTDETVLIPVPSSSQIPKNGLWVSERLADAFFNEGIGHSVVPCLKRQISIRKSAYSPSGQRPTALEHFDSFIIDKVLDSFDRAILVDDVITRGATLMGAANKIHGAMPNLKLSGFAAIRTISDSTRFKSFYDPVKGTVTLDIYENLSRTP